MPPLSNSGVVTWISRPFGAKVGECIGLNMLLQLGFKLGEPADCRAVAGRTYGKVPSDWPRDLHHGDCWLRPVRRVWGWLLVQGVTRISSQISSESPNGHLSSIIIIIHKEQSNYQQLYYMSSISEYIRIIIIYCHDGHLWNLSIELQVAGGWNLAAEIGSLAGHCLGPFGELVGRGYGSGSLHGSAGAGAVTLEPMARGWGILLPWFHGHGGKGQNQLTHWLWCQLCL